MLLLLSRRIAEDPRNYFFNPKWMEYLVKPSHRPFTTGFYFGEEIKQHYKSSSYIRSYDIVGVVKSYHKDSQTAVIEQRNKVLSGDIVEIMTPKGDNKTIELLHMRNAEGVAIGSAPSAQMIFTIQCSEVLREGDMLIKSRRANSTNG